MPAGGELRRLHERVVRRVGAHPSLVLSSSARLGDLSGCERL